MFQGELCKARESVLNHFECMCLEIKKVMDAYEDYVKKGTALKRDKKSKSVKYFAVVHKKFTEMSGK